MGAVITDLLYTVISLGLVHMVGQTLSRNSRAFLPQKPGQDGMAEAVTRVLVVAYYLLALGFIALTMPTWSHVASPGRAMELLSVQVGILLLVLGGLHLAGTAVLARLRRSRTWRTRGAAAGQAAAAPAAMSDPGEDGTDGADAGQRSRSAPFWRPRSGDTVN